MSDMCVSDVSWSFILALEQSPGVFRVCFIHAVHYPLFKGKYLQQCNTNVLYESYTACLVCKIFTESTFLHDDRLLSAACLVK